MHKKRSRVVSEKKSHLQCCAALSFILHGVERLHLVTFLENVTLHQILGWWVKKGMAYTVQKMCFPSVAPAATIPSSLGSDSYLVEVGGPDLSLLGLSFICEMFVCSALHCHTALANLPNESQELHNGKNDSKTPLIITDRSALH